MSDLCIGWEAHPEHPCTTYGQMHGCNQPEGHHGPHTCPCGATHRQHTRRRMGRPETATCGTTGGYHAHRRRGETACDACRAAHNTYKRNQRLKEAS